MTSPLSRLTWKLISVKSVAKALTVRVEGVVRTRISLVTLCERSGLLLRLVVGLRRELLLYLGMASLITGGWCIVWVTRSSLMTL